MKLDLVDIFTDACATLLGRLIATAFVTTLGMALGLYFGSSGNISFFECFAYALPALVISILSVAGIITLPILLGFTVLFTRYEWHPGFLVVPFLLSFNLGF